MSDWRMNEERTRTETIEESAKRLKETVAEWSRFETESEEESSEERKREPRLVTVNGMDAVLV